MNKFIGERLVSVTEPWDGDCDGDEMILHFESGTLHITAGDAGEPGHCGCPFIFAEESC
jgi:hypothetical protein